MNAIDRYGPAALIFMSLVCAALNVFLLNWNAVLGWLTAAAGWLTVRNISR